MMAQNWTSEGTVKDSNGQPLIGVSVMVKGTNQGTTTNIDGKYFINIKNTVQPVLVFTYVGYEQVEIKITASPQVNNVVMQSKDETLDEVVVVGYGTQKKGTVSGSVAGVSGKEIVKSPAMNVTNALAGNISGLVVVGQSGEPGADNSSLYIRGTGTLNDNSPLVVVDGVPGRSLERIDPSTIENISVLKDASAAIYGSQAANGVILVTTKQGKAQKMQIGINYSAGWSQPTKIPQVCNASEYATLVNEVNQYNGDAATYSADEIEKYANGSDPWKYPNTNWYNEVLKTWSMQHNANVTLTGGTEALQTFISYSSRYQDGFFKNSGSNYAQQDLNANIIGKLNKYITLNTNISGRLEQGSFLSVGAARLFYELQSASPLVQARWPNGLVGPPLSSTVQDNPVAQSTSAAGYAHTDNYVFNLTSKLDIKIPWVEGLNLTFTGAWDRGLLYTKTLDKRYDLYTWDGTSVDGDGIPVLVKGEYGGEMSLMQQLDVSKRYMVNSLLNYQHTFNNVHNLGVLVGVEAFENTSNWFSASRKNNELDYPEELNFGNDNEKYANGSTPGIDRWLNYLGRINYAYEQKYLLEFVWRYQGSSKFYKDNRYGFFPGISGAYRISEEDFWKNSKISNLIDGLKLRGSWGLTGNDKIDSYQFLSQYAKYWQNFVTGDGTNMAAYYESLAGNITATWEEARQLDFGLDMNMFNNRLSLTFDYFNNLRSKILIPKTESVPDYTGLSDILPDINLGKVSNKGFDFELSWADHIGDVKYRIGVNGGHAQNKILYFDESSNVPDYQKNTGHPMYSGLYYEAIGIYRTQEDLDKYPHIDGARLGDVIFKNVNDDNVIDGKDEVRINKSSIPTWTGGMNISLQYKGFDFSTLIQGQAGAVRYVKLTGSVSQSINYLKSFYDNRWTAHNINATYPRTYDGTTEYWVSSDYPNTFWLRKTDFIRLKNIELGYTLPSTISKKLACQSIRFNITGMNLFTYAPDMQNYDPELDYKNDGFSGEGYPIQRIITTGISINL